MDHLFRTAAFGGFQRQDVLTYLEQTAKEQQEKQQQLQQELAQARETADRQSRQLSEQGERLNTLAGENQQLRAQLEELRQSLSASQAQAGSTGEELARVKGELEACLLYTSGEANLNYLAAAAVVDSDHALVAALLGCDRQPAAVIGPGGEEISAALQRQGEGLLSIPKEK